MIHLNFTLSYFEVYILTISLITFLFYGYDKLLAIKDSISRVSENKLLLLALLGGIIGALFSMFLFRHKIKKPSFMIKFIVVVLVQIAIIFLYVRGII